jgi:hypothetical protein
VGSNERLIDRRMNVRVPLQFRRLDNPNSPEQFADSKNISQRGIYFETLVPLKVGTPLEVSMRMPREPTRKPWSHVRCLARVIHVRANSPGKDKAGVGLHIERFEVRTSIGER